MHKFDCNRSGSKYSREIANMAPFSLLIKCLVKHVHVMLQKSQTSAVKFKILCRSVILWLIAKPHFNTASITAVFRLFLTSASSASLYSTVTTKKSKQMLMYLSVRLLQTGSVDFLHVELNHRICREEISQSM